MVVEFLVEKKKKGFGNRFPKPKLDGKGLTKWYKRNAHFLIATFDFFFATLHSLVATNWKNGCNTKSRNATLGFSMQHKSKNATQKNEVLSSKFWSRVLLVSFKRWCEVCGFPHPIYSTGFRLSLKKSLPVCSGTHPVSLWIALCSIFAVARRN